MDRIRNQPLAGAQVYLSGTSHATEAGADGFFRMEGDPPGALRGLLHPPPGGHDGVPSGAGGGGGGGRGNRHRDAGASPGGPHRGPLPRTGWRGCSGEWCGTRSRGTWCPGARVTVTWANFEIRDAWPYMAVGEDHGGGRGAGRRGGSLPDLRDLPWTRGCGRPRGWGRFPGRWSSSACARASSGSSICGFFWGTPPTPTAAGNETGAAAPTAEPEAGRDPGPQAAPARRSSISSRMVTREDIGELRMESAHALDIVLRAIPALELRGGNCLTNRRGMGLGSVCTPVMLLVDGLPHGLPRALPHRRPGRGDRHHRVTFPPNEPGPATAPDPPGG